MIVCLAPGIPIVGLPCVIVIVVVCSSTVVCGIFFFSCVCVWEGG